MRFRDSMEAAVEYDFTQTVNTVQLLVEIATAALPAPNRIDTTGTAIQVFYTSELTVDQLASLTTVVTNHVANPAYVNPSAQADVTRLLGYLNNPNVAISNTARAAIVMNLAPRLPPGLVATINAQIAAALGG